ncbi:hypothetical protein, partial [Staphylococcus aureus]|uniref:hypothetical protein n=1 Tax=Staphylococcus aureus TaxID=1280 RepID=UPI00301C647D
KMRNKTKRIICIALIIILAVVSSLTVTLCGGTLTQNRLGTGSCSFAQTEFSGFASPFQYQIEFMAVAGLFIVLIVIVLGWFAFHKLFGKCNYNKQS